MTILRGLLSSVLPSYGQDTTKKVARGVINRAQCACLNFGWYQRLVSHLGICILSLRAMPRYIAKFGSSLLICSNLAQISNWPSHNRCVMLQYWPPTHAHTPNTPDCFHFNPTKGYRHPSSPYQSGSIPPSPLFYPSCPLNLSSAQVLQPHGARPRTPVNTDPGHTLHITNGCKWR
jgi:hypothetical protein